MLNRYFLPSCFIGAAIVTVASPAFAKQALLPTDVASIAKSTVVRIEPLINSPGSGVIIGRYQERGKNVYVVLTAEHVVKHTDDEYTVVTPLPKGGKKRQKIAISTQRDIQKLPGVDLAIVRFRSERNFEVATVGNSDFTTEGAGVYIAGFPNPGAAIKRRVFQFTSSLISGRLDAEATEGEEEQAVDKGYALVYTSVTRAGMSGGPVFDVSGRVVGIHGRGDREETSPTTKVTPEGNQESGSQSVAGKTGFNLGIPVSTFLKIVPSAATKLGIKIDKSEPGIFNNTIALRGGNRAGSSKVPPNTNIREEEEDTAIEVVPKTTQETTPTTQVSPSRPPSTQAKPKPNNTPTGGKLW
ncbi:protease, putative [Nostoc sp. NIES-3756]|uniref:S1 family peptidase n=1 Tax=Nostoc sp. NIES-3756 TaxID=1751286 RepID=UPI00071EE236|nr:serine protease [Nostoc sp. NIES-3756]BAT56118.1 protease, putative [Nostoc sp. NIES-3756]